jgi:hypothetical protein
MGWRAMREEYERNSYESLQVRLLSKLETETLHKQREEIEKRKNELTAMFPDWRKNDSSPIYTEVQELERKHERIVLVLSRRGALTESTRAKAETQRREKIDAFIYMVLKETGSKITRTNIWTAAGYTDATEFERYQRDDPETTTTATNNFERILRMAPKDFIRNLDTVRARRNRAD